MCEYYRQWMLLLLALTPDFGAVEICKTQPSFILLATWRTFSIRAANGPNMSQRRSSCENEARRLMAPNFPADDSAGRCRRKERSNAFARQCGHATRDVCSAPNRNAAIAWAARPRTRHQVARQVRRLDAVDGTAGNVRTDRRNSEH